MSRTLIKCLSSVESHKTHLFLWVSWELHKITQLINSREKWKSLSSDFLVHWSFHAWHLVSYLIGSFGRSNERIRWRAVSFLRRQGSWFRSCPERKQWLSASRGWEQFTKFTIWAVWNLGSLENVTLCFCLDVKASIRCCWEWDSIGTYDKGGG